MPIVKLVGGSDQLSVKHLLTHTRFVAAHISSSISLKLSVVIHESQLHTLGGQAGRTRDVTAQESHRIEVEPSGLASVRAALLAVLAGGEAGVAFEDQAEALLSVESAPRPGSL